MRLVSCFLLFVVSMTVVAEPIKSLVGAAHSSLDAQDEEIDIPYVKDGLIAMYDGIWNAGINKHVDSTRQWMNLMTRKTATWNRDGLNVWFEDDGLVVQDARAQMNCIDFDGNEFTVEYVFMLLDSNTSRECLFEAYTHNDSFRYKAASRIEDFWNHGQVDYVQTNSKNIFFYRSENVLVPFYIASAWQNIGSTNMVGSTYKNGSFNSTIYAITPTKISPLGGFRIGRSQYTTFQKIFAIRIYNRALTTEEIAFNYAIDKERFGL